jgi:MFS family permease
VAIVGATFLSDLGHEMATAVLPLYLGSLGLGAAALGLIEGLADLAGSLTKLVGGVVGHRVEHKRPWTTLGYVVTAAGIAALGLARSVAAIVSLRALAWAGRGFRGPLRDFLLSDAVSPAHFGRAYGLERAADMLGAVSGPVVAAVLLALGVELRWVIVASLLPSLGAAAAVHFGVRERPHRATDGPAAAAPRPLAAALRDLPRGYWLLIAGVLLFGLGDFSRTFLILLASRALGARDGAATGVFTGAVLIYSLHNLVSAFAAYPSGRLGDRFPKRRVLCVGYALGVATHALLAWSAGSLGWLLPAVVMSGIYIAVEDTTEKAAVAEILPRELRALGLGILAAANAVGDVVSSLWVGLMIDAGRPRLAFGCAAAAGLAGVCWLLFIARPSRLQRVAVRST